MEASLYLLHLDQEAPPPHLERQFEPSKVSIQQSSLTVHPEHNPSRTDVRLTCVSALERNSKHVMSHTGEKPCKECEGPSAIPQLFEDMIMYTWEKPCVCQQCTKACVHLRFFQRQERTPLRNPMDVSCKGRPSGFPHPIRST